MKVIFAMIAAFAFGIAVDGGKWAGPLIAMGTMAALASIDLMLEDKK